MFAAGYWLVLTVVLLALGARTPSWFIHLIVDVNIVVIAAVSATAPTELRSGISAMYFVIPAAYVGTWLPRRQMLLHLVLLSVAAGTGLVAAGARLGSVPEMIRVLIVVLAISWGIGYFINVLVAHLNQQVMIDPLTGLMNRTGLAAVARSYTRAGMRGEPKTVVVIDLDGFKAVNDSQGHEAGDDVLRETATALRAALRPNDTVTRMGGDEFVVLLDSASPIEAREVVSRIEGAMPIAFSSGIALWHEGAVIDDAVAAADAAMYAEKARKRDHRAAGPRA
jgi:diguanylate cyclase (GGDEF)-like protein